MIRRKHVFLLSGISLVSLILYVAAYVGLGHRESGRARGAGEYFHYRDFGVSWQVYLFAPAAFFEAQMIQVYPKAFLANSSWATTPQRLVIRVPGNTAMFWFPSFDSKEKVK